MRIGILIGSAITEGGNITRPALRRRQEVIQSILGMMPLPISFSFQD
jgi:hypothetical protein